MVSERKTFFFRYKSMGANDLCAQPIWTPWAWLAGFIHETTKHCNILNLLALGLMFQRRRFLKVLLLYSSI